MSTFPGAKGATNWWSPSYDRDLDLVFIPVLEEGMVFFPSAQTLPTTGGRSFFTAIRALDASTGKVVWEHRQETRSDDDNTAGLMSTSGGVVFGADHGSFFALDSRSGNLLWTVETGGVIYSPPVTYKRRRRAVRVGFQWAQSHDVCAAAEGTSGVAAAQ